MKDVDFRPIARDNVAYRYHQCFSNDELRQCRKRSKKE